VEKLDSVAFQGVNGEDYPANLAEYVKENGSDSCADGLAASVDAYTLRCPDAKIVVSGWRYIHCSSSSSCHHLTMILQPRRPLRSQKHRPHQ